MKLHLLQIPKLMVQSKFTVNANMVPCVARHGRATPQLPVHICITKCKASQKAIAHTGRCNQLTSRKAKEPMSVPDSLATARA